MIRPFTCLAVLLAAGSGLYLYSEKHRTTLLDERIDRVVSDTGLIRARTSMLQAEWALLNQPDRLGTLAAKFLPTLQPIAPGQFVQIADLDRRLPAIGPPPVVSPQPSQPVAAPVGPPVVLSSATAPSGDAAADPSSIVPGHPAENPPSPAVRLASAVRHPTHPHRPTEVATVEGTDNVAPTVRRVVSFARPAPILASAWTRPSRVAYTPTPSPPFTGSALGMAHETMAPPMAAPGFAPTR